MKNIFILLFTLTVIFTGCSDNDSPPPKPPGPGPNLEGEVRVDLSNDALLGDWELYALNKHASYTQKGKLQNVTLRYPEKDGLQIHFLPDNGYYETNVRGDLILKGTYQIMTPTTVRFNYTKDGKEYTSERNFPALTNYRLTHQEKYTFRPNNGNFRVNATFDNIFRNMANTEEGFHPYIDKEQVSFNRLKGKWELVHRMTNKDGQITTYPENVGESYEFDKDVFRLYIKAVDTKTDSLVSTGNIIIIDDVIHLFYKDEKAKKREGIDDNPNLKPGEKPGASLFWIRNWGNKKDKYGNREGFQVYDRYMDIDAGGHRVVFTEDIAEFRRKS